MLIRNDFAENCRLIWVFSNFVQFNYMKLDRIGIPNFPVFTGIKIIPIPPVYVFAKNRYTGTVFYTGIVLC